MPVQTQPPVPRNEDCDDEYYAEGQQGHEIPITVGRHPYTVSSSPVTGAQVRSVASVPRERRLFLVVDGPADDVVLDDEESVEVRPGARFYTAPCPTFGR